ncbi:hypothetical protein ACNKHL_00585 [Shigella flexneri]
MLAFLMVFLRNFSRDVDWPQSVTAKLTTVFPVFSPVLLASGLATGAG